MGIFEDEAAADESLRIAADFVSENLASLLGKPEIIRGEVRVYEPGMHLRSGDVGY